MKIIVGTNNKAKLNAVASVFQNVDIYAKSVSSNVSAQPMSDGETKCGAYNRALAAIEKEPSAYGIGLEGGVMFLNENIYLCSWGVLVTPKKEVYTASGGRIPLPKEFIPKLRKGTELSEIMNEFAQKENVREKEGAIGILTNNLVDRSELFEHVLKLLKGQYEFYEK